MPKIFKECHVVMDAPSHIKRSSTCECVFCCLTDRHVVHRMKRTMLIGHAFILAVMSLTSSSADQSLECSSDNIDIITCVWNSSSVGDRQNITSDNCFLQGTLDIYNDTITVQGNLVPLEDSNLYEATLQFPEEELKFSKPSLPVSVYCGSQTKAKISDFLPNNNIKLSPPEKLQVDGANVSWTLAPHRSNLVKSSKCTFQLQYRQLEGEPWKDTDIVSIPVESCMLPEENLFIGKQYVVRVRSRYVHSKFWSEWTRIKWTSTVGRLIPTPSPRLPGLKEPYVTVLVVVLVLVFLALFCIHPVVRCLKNLFIIKPSVYFGTQGSIHEWTYKAWIGPFMAADVFIKADSDIISPVEIHDGPCSDAPYRKESCGSWKGKWEKNTSNFSNSLYFLSQSSKSKGVNQLESGSLELGSPQCSSGPEEGSITEEKVLLVTDVLCNTDTDNESGMSSMSSPLETSCSYKHMQKLRLEVQSPDSGFSPEGEEQESQEESGSEDLPSPPVMDNTLTFRHMRSCPVPLDPYPMPSPHPLLMPPGLAWKPGSTQPLEMPPLCISTNMLMADFSLIPCSDMVEPSSGDYMPVKKVQE